jgi:hypothetical protein
MKQYGPPFNHNLLIRAILTKQMQPPLAEFSYSPEDPTTTDVVEFHDLSSDMDGQIVSWSWDFGDGTVSTLQHPMHQFTHDGSYLVKLTVTDTDGLEETTVQTLTVQSSLQNPYVLLALDAIRIGKNAVIHSGDIGVNSNDMEISLSLGRNVQLLDESSILRANTIQLLSQTHVWDLEYNTLNAHKTAEIQGIETTTLTLPIASFPAIPTTSPGTTEIKVKKNKELEISPGAYGEVTVERNGKLIFTGGIYHMTRLVTGYNVQLVFLEPTELRIASELRVGDENIVGDDTLTSASEFMIYVLGEDTNEQPSVIIGQDSIINANIYAPNGLLLVKKNTDIEGALIGQLIHLQKNVHLAWDNGFS